MKKRIAITMGDAGGVGPEVAIKAALRDDIRQGASLVLLGDRKVFEEAARVCGLSLEGLEIEQVCTVVDFTKGGPTEASGRAAYECIKRALDGCLNGEFHGMVTAPISKKALQMAGYPWPGHTEMLADMTGTRDYAMMLVGGPLKVVLVTTHLPLKRVPEVITEQMVLQKIRLARRALIMFNNEHGSIGVCSLNPHAGEGGLLGTEEQQIISPAIEKAKAEGINVTGPIPADVAFYMAYKGQIDVLVSMYHDHGLTPLKMIAFDRGVNLTLGLPLIRTSPDHGTAYDIAYQGIAREESMAEAIRLAVSIRPA
jgi:4-hydroxythreonine-4-phosphate dehydrogenase